MTQLSSNPNTNGNGSSPAMPQHSYEEFDQPVILRQSPKLSRAVIWVILIFTGAFAAWAYFAKIEQVVAGTGQLEPKGTVKEIQAPVNGVVEEVFVEDGEQVEAGEKLLKFDSDSIRAEKESLLEIKNSLLQENQLYRAVLQNNADIATLQAQIDQLKLPPEVTALARNRLSLLSEAQVIRAQLGIKNVTLSPAQVSRLDAVLREYNSRVQAAELELRQLEQLYAQNELQIGDRRAQLKTDQQILADIKAQNAELTAKAKASLEIEQGIEDEIRPLVADENGAIARLQFERQRQQVLDRQSQLFEQESTGRIEVQQQQQQVNTRIAEIAQLTKEQQRIQYDIRQANAELLNAKSQSERNWREALDTVEQRLAAVDSELNKLIVENTKRIAEIDGQIVQAEETLDYQVVTAPIAGTIFDLQASRGFVPRSGQAEPLLKIVPTEDLIAEVFVSNRDIGFVRERYEEETEGGKPVEVDVRIDSYVFSRYGSIDGKILSIGSDALPPDEQYPYARFPVRIQLDEQDLRGRPLQSGMSVNVNIKIRENRRVYSLLTDLFSRQVDDLKRQQ